MTPKTYKQWKAIARLDVRACLPMQYPAQPQYRTAYLNAIFDCAKEQ